MIKTIRLSILLSDNRDALFYWGCFLMTFTAFPFEKYGLGASKSLSLFPFLMYCGIAFFEKKLYFSKLGRKHLVLIMLMMLLSFFICLLSYDYFGGFSMAFGSWAGFIINIGAYMTFMHHADNQKVYNMLYCLFCSFWFSLVFGVLEVIYFITGQNAIYNILTPLLRDTVFLDVHHLQLNFCEAGDAGQLVPGLLFLLVVTLKEMGHKFKKSQKIMIGAIVLMMIFFSGSASFIIVGSAALLLYYDRKLSLYRVYRYFKPVAILFLVSMGSFLIISALGLMSEMAGPLGRVASLFYNPEDAFETDLSSACRIGMWFVAFAVFSNNWLLGTGLGNFGVLFPKYVYDIPLYLQVPELVSKTAEPTQMTYSILSTAFCEGGVIGIIWLYFFIMPLFRADKKLRPFVWVFIIIAMQQMVVFSSAFCFIWLLLQEPKISKIFNGKEI